LGKKLGIGCGALVALVALIAIISAVAGGNKGETASPSSSVAANSSASVIPAAASTSAVAKPSTASPAAKPPAEPTPTVTPQEFTGTGQKAVPVTLKKGLLDAKMKYSGPSNFAVTVLGPSGSPQALLANVIGNYMGEQATHLNADANYALNVQASGPWTIQVTNVNALGGAGDPKPSAGTGPAVVAFKLKVGLTTVTMKHNGKSNFAVTLLNADGTPADLLANVIGPFDGSKATGITRPGPYLFNIAADGDWSLDVK
jgi:hypothetical protein